MNKVILMGRLVRDPDVTYTQGQKPSAIAKYSLAVQRKYKREGEPECDFIRCTAFGKIGEFAEKYLRKGTKVAVIGRIQTGSYTNKDGTTVYTTDVIVEEHEFCEGKNSSGAQQQGGGGVSATHQSPPVPSPDEFMNLPDGIDEELPFS
jgi:single-strand DNA-binding protein